MKDKNGKEIKVGDIVSFLNATLGKVTEVGHNYYVCNNWSDGFGNGGRMESSSYVEIIKSAEQETFTEQDEELLQKLLSKKEQSTKLRDAEKSLENLVDDMYEVSKGYTLHLFVIENIDVICDTLQAYKKHCVK